MRKKQIYITILFAFLIVVIYIQILVIPNYTQEKLVQIEKQKEEQLHLNLHKEFQERNEFNFLANVVNKMYLNKETIQIINLEQMESLTKDQFVKTYENNFLQAYEMIKNFYGEITFIEPRNEVSRVGNPTYTYWSYISEKDPVKIEVLESDELLVEVPNQLLVQVNYEYDQSVQSVVNIFGTGSQTNLNFNKLETQIRINTLRLSTERSMKADENKSIVVVSAFQPEHNNPENKLKEVIRKSDIVVEHR